MHENCIQKLASMEKNTEGGLLSAKDVDNRQSTQMTGIFNYQTFLRDSTNGKKSTDELGQGGRKSDGYEFVNLRKILMRIGIFIAITGFFFIGFAYYAHLFMHATMRSGAYLIWSAESGHHIQTVHYRMRMLYSNATISAADTELASRYQHLNDSLTFLEGLQDAFMYGSPYEDLESWFEYSHESLAIGFPDSVAEMAIIFNSNKDSLFAGTKCGSLDNNSASHGLYNLIRFYVDTTYDVLAAMKSLPPAESLAQMEDYPPLAVLDDLVYECIPSGMDSYVAFHQKPMVDTSNVVNGDLHIVATVVLVVCMAVFYWVVFKPLMMNVEREVALTPSMLLMLPPNVLMKVESIRAFTKTAKMS